MLCAEPDCKMDQKRIATKHVKSLNLQPDMRTRALVLVAADSASGSSLRDLLQLNDNDEDLKSLVVSYLEEQARGHGAEPLHHALAVFLDYTDENKTAH